MINRLKVSIVLLRAGEALGRAWRGWLMGSAVVAVTLGLQGDAFGNVLYLTSISGSRIATADTTTGAVNTVVNTPSGVDSLVFDPTGRIIYTEPNANQVRIFNPTTHSDALLATPAPAAGPLDIALEPSGLSVLVAVGGGIPPGAIERIVISTGTVTLLSGLGSSSANGLVYDNAGHLYAVLDRNAIDQINPVTGAVVATSGMIFSGIDGLAFDPLTGHLFAASSNGYVDEVTTGLAFVRQIGLSGSIPGGADGIASDGTGNLFVAGNSTLYQISNVNTASPSLAATAAVLAGLDDLAPASGLGAPATPEPSSLVLCGIGLLTVGFRAAARRLKPPLPQNLRKSKKE